MIKEKDIYFDKLEQYLTRMRAPRGSFLYGKSLSDFIKNKIKNPKIFVYEKPKFLKKDGVIIFSSKIRKKELDSFKNFYYFKGEYKFRDSLCERSEITPEMKQTAFKIFANEVRYKFFDEKLPVLKEIFNEQSEGLHILKNIEHFLLFKDGVKSMIWFLCCENDFFKFDTLLKLFFKNKELFKGFSYETFNRFFKIINGHRFTESLFDEKTPLSSQADWWLSVFKKYPFAIGALEIKDGLSSMGKKSIIEYLEEIHNKGSRNIIPPLDLNIEGVRELVTDNDLKTEGKVMRHCVGGYGNQIKQKKSRIFSIKLDGESATVEFIRDQDLIRIKQLKGVANSAVESKKISNTVFLLREELQSKYLKEFQFSRNFRHQFEAQFGADRGFRFPVCSRHVREYYRLRGQADNGVATCNHGRRGQGRLVVTSQVLYHYDDMGRGNFLSKFRHERRNLLKVSEPLSSLIILDSIGGISKDDMS